MRENVQESAEAVLLVDASNAFNSLNRMSALYNILDLEKARQSIAKRWVPKCK